MKTHAWPLVAASAIALACMSCVLLVDDSTQYGLTCHFASEGVAGSCGQCIAQACQSSVNACCGDSNCTGKLGDLDTCAASGTCKNFFDDGNETTLSTDSGASSGVDGGALDALSALGACVQTSCASLCENTAAQDDASTSAPSAVVCSTDKTADTCTCKYPVSATASDVNACSPATLGAKPDSALCCGPTGWTTTGTCTCYAYLCLDNVPDGCDCTLGTPKDPQDGYDLGSGCDAPQVDDTSTQTAGCCISNDKLECYCAVVDQDTVLCEPGFSSIGSCRFDSIGCPKAESATDFTTCN